MLRSKRCNSLWRPSSPMRNLLFAIASSFALTATASAQVMNPYDGAPPPVVAPPVAAPPVAAPPAAQPLQPYGPTPGYYYPPPGYAPPMYAYPPPPVYYVQPARPRRVHASCHGYTCAPGGRARLFSVGLRVSGLGVNQQINNHDVLLGGVGAQLRFRTRGRFGIE